jgi:hypothetical protein
VTVVMQSGDRLSYYLKILFIKSGQTSKFLIQAYLLPLSRIVLYRPPKLHNVLAFAQTRLPLILTDLHYTELYF